MDSRFREARGSGEGVPLGYPQSEIPVFALLKVTSFPRKRESV